MSRRVQHRYILILRLKKCLAQVDGDTMLALLFVQVGEEGEFEGRFSVLMRHLLHLINIMLFNLPELMQYLAHQSTFTRVYVSNNNHIDISLQCFFINDNAVVLIRIIGIQNISRHFYSFCLLFLLWFGHFAFLFDFEFYDLSFGLRLILDRFTFFFFFVEFYVINCLIFIEIKLNKLLFNVVATDFEDLLASFPAPIHLIKQIKYAIYLLLCWLWLFYFFWFLFWFGLDFYLVVYQA